MFVCIRLDEMEFERLTSEVRYICAQLHGTLLNVRVIFFFLKSFPCVYFDFCYGCLSINNDRNNTLSVLCKNPAIFGAW
jgi:hypothetical protein